MEVSQMKSNILALIALFTFIGSAVAAEVNTSRTNGSCVNGRCTRS